MLATLSLSLPHVDWSLGAGAIWLAAFSAAFAAAGMALVVHGLTLAPE